MPKKDGDNYIISETGNWNVAEEFSKDMIMKELRKASYYEDVANFGYESLSEELLSYSLPPNDVVRYLALKRLVSALIKVIRNAKFALTRDKTKQEALKYKEILETKIKPALPNLIITNSNKVNNTSSIKIKDYALFDSFVEKVSEIRSKINEPLNRNHLIFTDKEEFDPKAFKNNLKRRMINEG